MSTPEKLREFLAASGISNFSAREVAPVGRKANGTGPALVMPPSMLWPHIIPTLAILEELRGHFMKPVLVNSGYRDPAYNAAVGGSPNSQHMRFSAIDFRVEGVAPRVLAKWLHAHPLSDTLGVGLYASFVHVDTRGLLSAPAPSRWSGAGIGRWW